MRTIKTTTGARVALDGDLLTMLETLYRELTAKRELERSFEDTVREIQSAIEQMTDAERRQYLSESLFLNFVSYENERLGAYLRKLGQAGVSPQNKSTTRTRARGSKRRKRPPSRYPGSQAPEIIPDRPTHPGKLTSVAELPRHPLHLLLAVVDDGPALRRPPRLRLRRSPRQARPRRREAGKRDRGLDRRARHVAADGPQQRRIEILRRLRRSSSR